jgi:sugar phosphate isomerase/epimerase
VPAGLIFSSAAFFARPLEQTFRLAAETGFSGVEVTVTKDPASQDGARMRMLADRYDMRIGAIHAPCLLLTRRVWGTDPVGKVERSIEVAREAGAPLVVVHPPYRWQINYQRWLTDKLPELSANGDVIVAVENMFPLWIGERGVTLHANQDIEELNEMPDIVLDTSHAAVAGHDLVQTRRLFGERIRHVHLSDNAGRGWDSHLPPGEGVLDIDGFLEDLVTGGYDGDVSLEVDLRRYLTDDEKLRDVMVSMRARCQERMAAAAATEG